MLIELGHLALALALGVAALQALVPLYGAHIGSARLMAFGSTASILLTLLVCFSFLVLTNAYVTSDFSVLNVANNSHPAKPLLYKISGVWGNHEGSMLLWILIIAAFGAAVAAFGQNLPDDLKARVVGVQGIIAFAFLLFILLTSNPFVRLDPAPLSGADLNPVLQDPALALHPPFLYLGYVGFSVAFSFAVAALIAGRVDAAWARWVRPWTLAAWVFLTIGIALGSYWAYYELGWGGWWFWDPVENASLLPWLAGTALLHSAIVVEKRETLKVWTILLAILAFSLSLVGTFIVRSGLLTSVHAFALDPERGLFILGILIVTIGGSLTLFAWRAPSFSHGRVFAPISRESALILNNLLLTVSCAAVLLGTLYPLFVEALTGNMLSVGPPYFNLTFGPLMLPLLIAMPFGPILAWKRGDLGGVMQRLALAGGLALAGALIVYVLTADGPVLAVIGIGLGIWLVVGAATEIALRIKLFQGPWQTSLARAKGLARSVYGTMLAHAGVGILVLGITGITAWRSESFTVMQLGETKPIGPYTISFDTMEQSDRDNFRAEVGSFTVMREGREVGRLDSEKRFYWTVRQPTTEVGLHKTVWGDLYVVLGDSQPDRADAFVVRAYYNPLANWIWVGSFIMAIGGVLSLTDRRLRVGAPAKRRRAAPAQPAEVPAE